MKKFTKSLLFLALTLCSVTVHAGQSDWCETPTGHFGKADFGDASSHILLTITKGAEANSFTVKIKAASDNTKGLSYMRAYCEQASTDKEVKVGELSNSSTLIDGELVANFTVPESTSSATIDLQWSNPAWAGTWCMGNGVNDGCAAITIDMGNLDCGGECDLTEAPILAAPTEGTITPYTIALKVSATDEKGNEVTKFVVSGNDIPEQTLTAKEGVITIANLIPATEYTISVQAKDACANVSDAQEIVLSTEERNGDCEGQLGHFGNPDVKKIAYTIAYVDGKVIYTVTPVDASKSLDFCEIQQSVGGNYGMTIAADGKSATYETTYDVSTVMVRFLYSLDDMDGNEMTAEYITSPEAVYYIVGECEGNAGGEGEEEGEEEGDSTAVGEVDASDFSMYPNPTVSNINIVSERVMKRIEVRSQNGQVVMEVYPNAAEAILNVANLAKGRYVVTIYNDIAYQTETILVR